MSAPCGNVGGYCGGKAAGYLKFDLNNGGPISTDFVGGSWQYPEANYSEREAIFEAHKLYTQSFLWFMSTDSQLDASIKTKFGKFGLCADEFQDTDHWPPQMYVRAARRLIGDIVFNENTPTQNRTWGNLSIGYDCHTSESGGSQRVSSADSQSSGVEVITLTPIRQSEWPAETCLLALAVLKVHHPSPSHGTRATSRLDRAHTTFLCGCYFPSDHRQQTYLLLRLRLRPT